MRTKSGAQAFLESYEMSVVKMECKLAERQKWHDLSLSITGQMDGERVQSSGVKDKMAQARDRCVDLEGEILLSVNELAYKQKKITQALDLLDNPTEYKLLHQKYIQLKPLKTIADNFHASYDWATTTHGRALKSLQKILDVRKIL